MKRGLVLAVTGAMAIALTPALPAAAANPVIGVDLGASTGAVTKGAAGFLYGLSNDGIPNENTLAPLHPSSTYQKAPDGAQHPGGDALKVAPEFLRSTGGTGDIGIYMQDFLTKFPYENPGIDAYVKICQDQARKVVADPNRSRFVYVPFNEPDGNWYGGDLSGLEMDWKRVYQAIRSIDPTARIAGPNYFAYNATDYKGFLQYTQANNVLPDITTWHELDNSFFTGWYDHIADYRAAEQSLGISPRPVDIDEYGRSSGDLGVPGNLVQWVTRLENSKVSGNLAFWTDEGALDDLVANFESNKVTGGWWLYKWYGELTGNTVKVTPPTQNGSLQAMATYDGNKKQARVILGGSANATDVFSTDVQVKNVPAALGSSVHLTVLGVDNSGVNTSTGPYVVAEQDATVTNGAFTLPLTGLKALSAYEVLITPNSDTSSATAGRYEAEYADLSGGARVTYGSNSGYSGTYFAEGYGASSIASTNFVVNVPSDGYYNVSLRYAAGPYNGAPTNRQTRLVLNGTAVKDVSLAGTANWNTWNTVTTKLYLQGGINRIGVSAFTNDDSDAINVDYIDLAATTGTVQSIEAEAPGNTLAGNASVQSTSTASGGSYVGYVGQGAGNTLTVNGVNASAAGQYDVVIQYANSEYSGGGASYNTNSVDRYADISVNGGTAVRQYFRVTGSWSTFRTTVLRTTLNAGSNTIKFSNSAAYAPDIDKVSIAAIVG